MTDPRHPIDVLNDAADLEIVSFVIAGYDRYGEWQVLTTEDPHHARAIVARAYRTLDEAAKHEPMVLHS